MAVTQTNIVRERCAYLDSLDLDFKTADAATTAGGSAVGVSRLRRVGRCLAPLSPPPPGGRRRRRLRQVRGFAPRCTGSPCGAPRRNPSPAGAFYA
eukprot:scaffold39865_cov62-Phaeocystis_antarctica.AAC.5